MIIVRPNLYVPGTVIRSAEVNDDFDTIYNDYNGNITNANVSATAGIEVSKLETIPTGSFLIGNAGVPTIAVMSGDASVNATGVVTVVGAGSVTVSNDNASAGPVYPTWVTANTGNLPLYVSDTNCRFYPATGNVAYTGTVTGTRGIFNIATGTAPLTITSTTVVPNLNVDQLDGYHAASFGASLDTNGNNIRLLNPAAGVLSTITAPYATTAGTVNFGTAGSVVFSDGTTLDEDNANFFWDDGNNRLGIGTNGPSYKLDVHGTGSIIAGFYTTHSDAVIQITSAHASGHATVTFSGLRSVQYGIGDKSDYCSEQGWNKGDESNLYNCFFKDITVPDGANVVFTVDNLSANHCYWMKVSYVVHANNSGGVYSAYDWYVVTVDNAGTPTIATDAGGAGIKAYDGTDVFYSWTSLALSSAGVGSGQINFTATNVYGGGGTPVSDVHITALVELQGVAKP